jgi:hypothetical protein
MKLSYQALIDNPGPLDSIQAYARRERAEEVQRLIVVPFTSLFTRSLG